MGRRATANTGVGGAKGVERDVRSQVLVVRENSVAKTGSTTVEEKEEGGGGGGGSHQEGARLVASGVEREKREKVKRGMKGGRERRKERK